MMKRFWREDEGVMTFEWILLTTVLVIGIVGGLSGVRDATNLELTSVVGGMMGLDQSYSISQPLNVAVIVDGKCAAGGVESSAYDPQAVGYAFGRAEGTFLQVKVDYAPACNP